MLLVHQVITGTECHQVCVVGRRRDGDRTGAAHVGVAQLVGEHLQLIGSEMVVVPEDMVVGWPAGALQGVMGKEKH